MEGLYISGPHTRYAQVHVIADTNGVFISAVPDRATGEWVNIAITHNALLTLLAWCSSSALPTADGEGDTLSPDDLILPVPPLPTDLPDIDLG